MARGGRETLFRSHRSLFFVFVVLFFLITFTPFLPLFSPLSAPSFWSSPFGSIFFLLAHSLKMCLELLCKRAENSGIEFAVSCKNAVFSRISHSVGTLILKKYPVTASTRWRSFNSLSLFFRVRCWLFLMLRCDWENQNRKEYRWNKDKEKERTCDRKNFRLFQQRLLQQINVSERASDWLIDVQVQQFFLIIV